MAVAQPDVAIEPLDRLVKLLERHEGFPEVVAALAAGHAATLDGVWGSSRALCAAALQCHVPGTLLVVAPTDEEAEDLADDLRLFSSQQPVVFPSCDAFRPDRVLHDEAFGQRTALLHRLAGPTTETGARPKLAVTSIIALLQPVPHPAELRRHTRRIAVGEQLRLEELTAWLVEEGFHATTGVELPGEFSVRGGIVDLFALDWELPVRVELFGDQVDSIRRFEVASQRSREQLTQVEIATVAPGQSYQGHLAEYLPAGSWVMLCEPEEIQQQASRHLQRLERLDWAHGFAEVMAQLIERPNVTASAIAASSLETLCQLRIESVERLSGAFPQVRDELDSIGREQQVFLVCQTEAECQRLTELLRGTRLVAENRLRFALGRLSEGFRLVNEAVTLVGANQLLARSEIRRPVRRRLGQAIDSFMELREGDLVVHVSHGVARYRGMQILQRGQQCEEHLVLEFQEGSKLYVPASKIGLVQKYVGATKGRPRLAKLGGRLWQRRRQAVEKAVSDLAAELLEIQAARQSRPGIAFPPDTEWQREFDASFPFQETDDQLAAIEAVKHDMMQPRPMDRLLCGDVGFGKTELAMRAAFKAVDAGYQVAVLVPTTVLAEQHFRTFTERMAAFPFRIAMLSRFATGKQQKQTIEQLATGQIDIVIGTHRLVSGDVCFQNLGLVIIDEEQRFGVEVKERLKTLRQIVDVLTMTATPIPRTLHMALTGLRDIANLETPPEDRLAVETRIARFDPQLVRHAVIRELNRNGQIFYVHNRVADIDAVGRRLVEIVPEARIGIAHAQMPEHRLEQVMVDFVAHRFDLLLTTTIIENGLDIPNANTIFIDDADRFGLADLHQLRGRVGRYKHRAYCYLLVDPNKHLTPNAIRRLKAIEEFSHLGAGFALAMRDLEIRGAGNILGKQQSGHISAVGYELYCQLLEQAVRRLKRLPPKTTVEVDVDLPCRAFLPRHYVPDMRMKIDLYRRLARVTAQEQLDDFRSELIDRFGPLPPPAEAMFKLASIRVAAHGWKIRFVRRENGYVVFGYSSRRLIEQFARRCNCGVRVVDDQTAYLPVGKRVSSPERLLDHVKSLLQCG